MNLNAPVARHRYGWTADICPANRRMALPSRTPFVASLLSLKAMEGRKKIDRWRVYEITTASLWSNP